MKRNAALPHLLVLGLLGSCQIIHASAFLEVNGVFTTISVPSSLPGSTAANGINNLGQIVGSFNTSPGGNGLHGFLDTNGVFTTLDVPGSPLAKATEALGINDAGQIVGDNFLQGSGTVGFLYANGIFSTILVPGTSFNAAVGINDSVQIVGDYFTSTGQHGFLYMNGTYSTLDYPGASGTMLSGINNLGEIVGTFVAAGNSSEAFVYSNRVFTPIQFPGGAIASAALGINDSGQIVGVFTDTSQTQHGFVDTNGVFQIIGSAPFAGGPKLAVNGINNAGEIVGIDCALDATGCPSIPPTPEPSSLLLTACGLGVLTCARRCNRRKVRYATHTVWPWVDHGMDS